MSSLYLYPVWLRVWHWTNAVLFLALMVTGVSMHYSDAGWLIPFETAVPIHNACGILLTLAWVGFAVGNLAGGNRRFYRIRLKGLVRGLWLQTRWYMYGIFRDEPHPFAVTRTDKLNPLQKLAYLGVMAGLMPLLMLSGWAFLFAMYLPETIFGIGTVWIVAMTHMATSWMLVLFLLTHLYMITTGETPWTSMHAMLTGWHNEHDGPADAGADVATRAETGAGASAGTGGGRS